LERALAQLEKSLAFSRSPLARQDEEIARQFRAAAIQAFKFTYELSHKMLRRYLAAVDPNPGSVADLAFPDLIRAGYAKGLLLRPWQDWAEYRRKRGITSQTYDAEKAGEVFAVLPGFVEEVRHLLSALRAAPAE
jgi:nucleotidyltransferase substrate binding protein (TIGR01987 family)